MKLVTRRSRRSRRFSRILIHTSVKLVTKLSAIANEFGLQILIHTSVKLVTWESATEYNVLKF